MENYHGVIKVAILSLQQSYKEPYNAACFHFTNRKKFYGVLCGLDRQLTKFKSEKNNLFTSITFLEKIFTIPIKNWEPELKIVQIFNQKPPEDAQFEDWVYQMLALIQKRFNEL